MHYEHPQVQTKPTTLKLNIKNFTSICVTLNRSKEKYAILVSQAKPLDPRFLMGQALLGSTKIHILFKKTPFKDLKRAITRILIYIPLNGIQLSFSSQDSSRNITKILLVQGFKDRFQTTEFLANSEHGNTNNVLVPVLQN